MNRIIQVIIVISILFVGCKEEKANRHYQNAYNLEEEDKYEEAIKELDKAIELNPKFEQAYLDRAIDKSIIGDFEGAIEDLDIMIKLLPNAIEPYACRAEYKRMLEQYEDALEDVDKALELKSYTSVIQEINTNIIEDKFYNIELEYILYERACSNYMLGNYDIIDDLNYCIRKKMMLKDCFYMRGMVYIASDMKAEGCQDLNTAEKLETDYTSYLIEKYCE
ncbi:MAG: tetratricopeptide (TPR) repeat protein [Saprospiraceae bacterium]|jgi:tetratricopeptide (TPR) repeat protein